MGIMDEGVHIEFYREGHGESFWSTVWAHVPRKGDYVNIPAGYTDENCETDLPCVLYEVVGVGWGRHGRAPRVSATIEVCPLQDPQTAGPLRFSDFVSDKDRLEWLEQRMAETGGPIRIETCEPDGRVALFFTEREDEKRPSGDTVREAIDAAIRGAPVEEETDD